MKADFLKILFGLFYFVSSPQLYSQNISGQIIDNATKEPLAWATITIYQQGKTTGLISNKDGNFLFSSQSKTDSIKITMIGYESEIIKNIDIGRLSTLLVALKNQSIEMQEVVVKPLTALEIMEKAAAKIRSGQPTQTFETSGFYREVIKDAERYFSVAEAVFKVQFFPAKDDYKIQLIKGRSREDVAYTLMFEDYHPGGGPQQAMENSFLNSVPDFLKKKEQKHFEFRKLKSTSFDGSPLYVIEFDQKPGVKEALEKGKVFIDAEDFSVVKFEAETSPLGLPYIKHLTGTDKLLAGILNIVFIRKGWRRTVSFVKANDKWFMNHVDMELKIGYKQPKKKLDLDLTLVIELLLDGEQHTVTQEISRDEEWKSKDLVKNLPAAFDSTYWGSAPIITASGQIKDVINAIPFKNGSNESQATITGWNKLNAESFVSYASGDTITIVPTVKSYWQDDNTGAMLYKTMKNNFSIETRLDISKTSDKTSLPDKGHQQCGIIIRSLNAGTENNIMLTKGTNGNKSIKLLITHTKKGKSKPVISDGIDWQYLRFVKEESNITIYARKAITDEWTRLEEHKTNDTEFEVGLIAFAHFAGNGPKMYPNIRGIFSEIKISQL